jgi:kynurenine 3-monooxygenase
MGVRVGPINVVGGGLAGALLAALLARRQFAVTIFDRRADPRTATLSAGRSINLALASRGWRALERAGLADRVRPLLIPMRGRQVHPLGGAESFQPYGQREDEVIYSVSRGALNRLLIEAAAESPSVSFRFGHTAIAAKPAQGALFVRDHAAQHPYEVALQPTIATDGAGSAIRASLVAAGLVQAREDLLEHGYKELTIPAQQGDFAFDSHALHVWPRGGHMLIALPNPGGNFTATLFMPARGPDSFESLNDAAAIEHFFTAQFPDARAAMPDLSGEFLRNPLGVMGTVYAEPWRHDGDVLLLGDAAHAIVPFHGQGMNCALEDCIVLDRLLDEHDTWGEVFGAFERERKRHADAIAKMALENYVEMRATVLDVDFQTRRALGLELERAYPERFIPRYSMVMFHPEIGYADALERGAVQQEILTALTAMPPESRADLARALIEARLPPLR